MELRERIIDLIAGEIQLTPAEREQFADPGYTGKFAKWDSAGHAQIIVALEDAFAIEVEDRMIVRLNTLDKIVEYVAQHTQ